MGMAMKSMLWIAAVASLSIASTAGASERVQFAPGADSGGDVETLTLEVIADGSLVWDGTLTIGPRYGSASFSQSKSETVAPCGGAPLDPNRNMNVNSSFNLSLSRTNWQQTPDRFTVNFNRSVALPACEGQGNDSSGFNRMVEIRPGSSMTIRGNNNVVVTISRP
jgi:hypothetical protein